MSALLDGTDVVPRCPAACCFRTICTEEAQLAALVLVWQAGGKREDCQWFALLAATHRRSSRAEPPARSEELMAQMARVP